MTKTGITAQTVAAEMAEQAAEILAFYRAGEVQISDEAVATARIAAGLSDDPMPRGARGILHTALADARTQVWRAGQDRKNNR